MHFATIAAIALAISIVTAPALAEGSDLPMTPVAFRPDLAEPDSRRGVIPVAGAECPTGSGDYCSDELPYCCPGVNTSAYCAADVNGCTK